MKTVILFVILALSMTCQSANKEKIDLSGEWKIKLDPDDVGQREHWYNVVFKDQITLPGSLQEHGYGCDIGVNTQWIGGINDRSWYDAIEYEKYRRPGNVKVPFWLNPEKHYVGVAWYQKEVNIPSSWKGRIVELELERTHWETVLYVDGTEYQKQNTLSTPHRIIIENLKPGKHILTLRVDNRINVNVGYNAHSVSDHTQTNWNGVIGKMHLLAKPKIYIENVQIYPNARDKSLNVNINLNETPSITGSLRFQVEKKSGEKVGQQLSIELNGEKDINVKINITEDLLLWSEHTPNLYRLRTTIISKDGQYETSTQFGFRDFEKRGTQFYVNDYPIFLRGTLECCIFPFTGYPSIDTKYWEKIYLACKDFGLNHVRFHSWCPPKAAFNVADSLGIYLQVECAGWTTVGDGGYSDEWFYAEGDRILKEYGNHLSFCLLAYGNEPGGTNQVKYLSELVDYWQKKDSRRLYTSGAGWPYVPNADYWNAPDPRIQAWGGGLKSIMNAQPPRTDFDYREIIFSSTYKCNFLVSDIK